MKLIDKLKEFAKSEETEDIIKTTISEIREIYRPQSEKEKAKNVSYHIFNSVWNRIPNFGIDLVLKQKLIYAFDIGTGLASYNQLPLSWITDTFYRAKNFLMKDRGHITTLVCWMYREEFSIKLIMGVVNSSLIYNKSVDNWKDDSRISKAVPILTNIKKYLDSVLKTYMENNTLKSKDCKVSLKNICENVPDFNKMLNHTRISIEARKESIWIHSKEILGLNNSANQWITFQKSFLSWVTDVMKIDGDDGYFTEVLNINKLRSKIDKMEGFNGSRTNGLLSRSMNSYKKAVKQFEEIFPLRLIAIRTYESKYIERANKYDCTKEKDLKNQLESLSKKNVKFDDAIATLDIANIIICNDEWVSYDNERKTLKKQCSSNDDTRNLDDSSIGKEDFGLACIDSIIELLSKVPGMDKRNPADMVNSYTSQFIEALRNRLRYVVEESLIFSAPKHMESRFNLIIKPAYKQLERDIEKEKKVSRQHLYQQELNKITSNLNGTSEFTVLLEKESYNKPKIVKIDFSKSRKEAKLDLGKKNHNVGYIVGNVFVQIAGHNREHSGDHNIDTLGYWKWFSEKNLKLVKDNEQWLMKDKQFDILADSEKLYKVFNK